MKDKNGKDIIINESCIVDNRILGVIRDIKELPIVLMLKESTSNCYEELVAPNRIAMI